MNLLFTICARAGSKGYKNKNVQMFLDNPLSYYTASAIDLYIQKNKDKYETITVAVNTDSSDLICQLNQVNLEFLYVARKTELATDTAAKIDVIKDTLMSAEKQYNLKYDFVIDLDLTSPIRSVEDIEHAVEILNSNHSYDIVLSATNARRNPYFNMIMEADGCFKRVIDSSLTARQQAPIVYDMNASIYVYRASFIKKEAVGIFDGRIMVSKMLDTAVLDIDSAEDFELMQILAEYFYKRYEKLDSIKTNIKKIKKE